MTYEETEKAISHWFNWHDCNITPHEREPPETLPPCQLSNGKTVNGECMPTELTNEQLQSKLDKQKDKVNDKIERKNHWKDRYNCFDKKEDLKTELERYKTTETKMIHNIKQLQEILTNSQTTITNLQSNLTDSQLIITNYNTTLSEAQFTIEKLKQEKAQLIKQIETLETQLSEN